MARDTLRLGERWAGYLHALTRGRPTIRSGPRDDEEDRRIAPYDPDHRPILIYGFHRGGTTYLQRLLNCSPDVCIWGEHAGVLSDYRRAYMRFAAAPVSPILGKSLTAAVRNPAKWSPWLNKHSVASYADLLRAHIIALFGVGDGRTRWGIKEIAYEDPADATFMLQLFPAARIILLRRNPVDLFLSQYFVRWNRAWRNQGLDACARKFVEQYRRRLSAFDTISAATSRAIIVDLENFRDTAGTFERLLVFLDLSESRFDHQALAVVNRGLVGSTFGGKGIEVDASAIDAARACIQQALAEAETMGSE